MIESFGDSRTMNLYHGKSGKGFPSDCIPVACRKLDMLHRAASLQDLRVPPGNRLEALKGEYKGYHSIRVNERWRIIFRWEKGLAYEVTIIDYH